MAKQIRRNITVDEKINILKKRLLEGARISEGCEKLEFTPRMFVEKCPEVFHCEKGQPSEVDRGGANLNSGLLNQSIPKSANTSLELTKLDRILLHMKCPCRNWQQIRFHIRGILREFRRN